MTVQQRDCVCGELAIETKRSDFDLPTCVAAFKYPPPELSFSRSIEVALPARHAITHHMHCLHLIDELRADRATAIEPDRHVHPGCVDLGSTPPQLLLHALAEYEIEPVISRERHPGHAKLGKNLGVIESIDESQHRAIQVVQLFEVE